MDVASRLAQRLRQQSAVAELGRSAISGHSDLGEIGEDAVGLVVSTLGANRCLLAELAPDGATASVCNDSHGRLVGRRLTVTGTAAQRLLDERAPVVVAGVGEPALPPGTVEPPPAGAAWASVGRPERPYGLLAAFGDDHGAFGPDDAHFLSSVANVIAEVVRRERVDAELRRHATHDSVTELPNRALLDDRLHQALAVGRRINQGVGIVFVDIDRFKVVNESLGHRAGDEVLRGVAARIAAAVRDSDTVARFGSDEFIVVASGVDGEADLVRVAEHLLAALADPLPAAGREIHVSASLGLCLAEPDAHAEPSGLLRDAAQARTRAKQRGGGSYALLDARQQRDAVDRLRVEQELRDGLSRGELTMHVQPFISLHDQRPTGGEALVRWRHPRRGLLGPAEFLDVAEHSGLIVPIGEWLLAEACRRTARWLPAVQGDFLLTVNVSSRQLAHPGVVDAVRAALAASGLAPERLGLELTEQVLVGDEDEAERTLGHLKTLGVRLLLDDFGTGYSSLSHLKRFPIDAVKIDRSFVGGLEHPDGDDAAIVSAILGMSWATGKEVIPEGIETSRQAERLLRMGCDLGQGFLYGPPVEVGEFESMLRSGRPGPEPAGG